MQDYAQVVNVEGAVVRDGEYLLVERATDAAHAGGLLAFPGGKVEPAPDGDASIEATARRELSEEVGLDGGTVEYVHSRTFVTDDGTSCLNVVTLCESEGGSVRPRASDEVTGVGWYSPDEIRDIRTPRSSSKRTSNGSRGYGRTATSDDRSRPPDRPLSATAGPGSETRVDSPRSFPPELIRSRTGLGR